MHHGFARLPATLWIAIKVKHDLEDDTMRVELVDLVRERIQAEGPRE